MTDVEKYGLFALVFVAGVLGLVLIQGAFVDEDGAPGAAAADPTRPVVIRSAADVGSAGGWPLQPVADPFEAERPAARDARPAARYTVRSVTADKASFDWNEPPVSYPGPRSVVDAPGDGSVVHVVRRGETLSDIARRYLGKSSRWREIQALNPGLDPKRLQVGDRLVVQAATTGMILPESPLAKADAAPARPAAQPQLYTVKKGDTLSEIAQRLMGSAKRSDELYKANRDVLASPDALKVGLSLRIP